MRSKNKLISALPRLQPTSVINLDTGEYLNKHEYETPTRTLIEYVKNTTQSIYNENSVKILEDISLFKGSANSYGRSKGYRIDYSTLAKSVRAKSRVQELVLHNLISETVSYVNSPTLTKQPPSFASQVNLGAVNAQMASIHREPGSESVYLKWKCWDMELLIEFNIPSYILKRDIVKWSLPVVQLTKTGEVVYYFSVQEEIPERAGKHYAGADVGVKEAYSAVVINENGSRVADYHASNRLKQLQRAKLRLVKERSFTRAKISKYQDYGLNTDILVLNQSRLSAKISRQGKNIALNAGSELARKLAKHNITILNLENLTWVTGTKGSKTGSNHSFQHARLQDAIEHANLRNGVRVRKVSARGTSQDCHYCSRKIVHNNRKRSVYCADCKTTLDRDFNAAMNIAKKIPPEHGFVGRKASGNTAPYGKLSVMMTLQPLLKNKQIPQELQLN